jgi:hypothetical protein
MIDKNLSYAYGFAEGGEVSPRELFTTKVRPDARKLRSMVYKKEAPDLRYDVTGDGQLTRNDVRRFRAFGATLRGRRPIVPLPDEEYAFFNNLYGPAGGTSPEQPVAPVPGPGVAPEDPPILYFGPDGQPVYGGIFPDQPDAPVFGGPVQPVAPPPQVMPIEPGGDFGLPPDQPVVSPPPIVQPVFDPQARTYFPFDRPAGDPGGSRTYGPGTPFVRPEGIMGLQMGGLKLS